MHTKQVIAFCLVLSLAAAYEEISCDVVIAGGSTAALAAALSSASEGALTCLLEPTDWPGGQMTASGVPAIDWAWHTLVDPDGFKLDVAEIDFQAVNQPYNFWKALHSLNEPFGDCWVSRTCYLPLRMLQDGFAPLISAAGSNLKIYLNSVVKQVGVEDRRITNITAISRSGAPGLACNGSDIFLSRDLPDWYSMKNSSRWIKNEIVFSAPIFMDLTDWGELLPLSGASYLQGIDEQFDGDISGKGNDTCGQAITYSFTEIYHTIPMNEPANPYQVPFPEHYTSKTDAYANDWNQTWTYRRLHSSSSAIKPLDITLQNCGGNDFEYGYIFLSKNASKATLEDWQGGVNVEVLWEAEREAMGWHYFYKEANVSLHEYITLDSEELGTCHGLAKMPYIRDSRRSIGIDNFVVTASNISGKARDMVGYVFPDRLAIGSYDVDVHGLQVCQYPPYMSDLSRYGVLPYFMPFRAMTNRDIDNLLVAGKTMAMSFLANAAMRLHPCEWASGTAAGVAASYMALNSIQTTKEALAQIEQIRTRSEMYTPSSWTINGTLYPPQ